MKKILTLFVTILLILGITSCGGGSKKEQEKIEIRKQIEEMRKQNSCLKEHKYDSVFKEVTP